MNSIENPPASLCAEYLWVKISALRERAGVRAPTELAGSKLHRCGNLYCLDCAPFELMIDP